MNLTSADEKSHTPSSNYVKPILGLIFLALVGLLYQNLEMAKKLLSPSVSLGPENWNPTPGAEGLIDFSADFVKRDAVVEAFKHAWLAYERDAMGDDEYKPISRKGTNLTDAGGIGYTVIDSIDTIQIMGLDEEYKRARTWIANSLSFDRNGSFNTFEVTIRMLGGLLSAYHLSSGDSLYLDRAIELADRMLPVFETPSGLPLSMVNLGLSQGMDNTDSPGVLSTAEAATIQLEFRYLTFLSENDEYWDRAENVIKVIKAARSPLGLAPIYLGAQSGQFLMSPIRLGSRGDSYYEYLLKQYLQTNRTEEVYREMYEAAMHSIHHTLIQKSLVRKLTYTSELIPERQPTGKIDWRRFAKQDHLVCFLGGSLMLGATTTQALTFPVSVPPAAGELLKTGKRDWMTGFELVNTCVDTYKKTATGLSPEIVYFRTEEDQQDGTGMEDWYIKDARPAGEDPPYDARYILRPETVESLFIAFRLTGDVRYRNYGWEIFQAIEKYCRIETGGYASILNVDDVKSRLEDKMETFLLSETLKYLYLLFSDASVLPLNEYVFNTEAHPLPIFTPARQRTFR